MWDLWWTKWHCDRFFPEYFGFSPVNFIPLVLHYTEKRGKELIIFITGLHNKLQGCGAPVASAAGPFITRRTYYCTSCVQLSRIKKFITKLIAPTFKNSTIVLGTHEDLICGLLGNYTASCGNYLPTCNYPKDHRLHQHRGGSRKSRHTNIVNI
jgi:hypothetical protein